MVFLESFKIIGTAVAEIFLLAALGYFLIKRNILGAEGLHALSRLVVEVTLPLLIFTQLIRDFSFSLYPDWWIFPLISIVITVAGLVMGTLFSVFIKGHQHKLQFSSLVTFQNSGYLPLALVAALLPAAQMDIMFVYLFLFLAGFNMVMFSLGAHMLTFNKAKKFELGSLFSPPVVATLISLAMVLLGLNRFVPGALLKPLSSAGACTVPLAMIVVGGNLAAIRLGHIDKKAVSLLILAKLIILPALGIWLVAALRIPDLIGLLIVIELSVPSATLLSVITSHYKKEDLLISQGIFFSHIVSLVTLPLFLSLYFTFVVLK